MSSALSMIEFGHRLAHADAGDARHHIVQALDVLDIQRCIDIDAGGDQFLDIHVAFGMAAAGSVGVGEFIHQRELRAACQQGVEVHFVERVAAVFDRAAWDGFQAVEQRLGFLAAVGFDNTDRDIGAFAKASLGSGQHFERLADAWRGAHEDLQATT